MSANRKNSFLPLGIDFVENLMPYAPSVYTVIYICALNMGNGALAENVAKKLNMSVNDVSAAAMYWQDRHILRFSDGKFVFPQNISPSLNKNFEEPQIAEIKKAVSSTEVKKVFVRTKPPQYQPEELRMYKEKNADIRLLFDTAEGILGRLITYNDMSALLSFNQWLGLKIDVILMLVKFCVDRGHKNMRYMESIAIDWCEKGINDVSSAQKRIDFYSRRYKDIMKAMGIIGREPIEKEMGFMKKWTEEYGMPFEVIKIACEKAVTNTGKASFDYANKILSSWNDLGFKTMEDVLKNDKLYADSIERKKQEQQNTGTSAIKPNGFTNYSQRKYDYAKIERLARERLLKSEDKK